MATKKAKQPYQYEPLITPSSWRDDEQRFSIRLTQIIDDLYQKYSGLRQKVKSSASDDGAIDADTLGGKAPEYYIQPRNLLINSDFTNPVNRRGQTSYIGTEAIDGWRVWNNDVLTVNSGHVTVVGAMFQYIEVSKVKNAKYTLAVGLADGTVRVITHNPTQEYYWANHIGFGFDGGNVVIISIDDGDIVWAAFYEGEYAAETLPPYVPKGYADELLACSIAETGRVHDSDKLGGVPAGAYATKADLGAIDLPASVQMDLLWEKQGSGIQVGSDLPLAGDITNYDYIVILGNHYKFGHRAFWFVPTVGSTVAVSAFGIANDTVTQLAVNECVLNRTSVTYSKKRGINLSTAVQSFDNIGDLLTKIYGVKGLLK